MGFCVRFVCIFSNLLAVMIVKILVPLVYLGGFVLYGYDFAAVDIAHETSAWPAMFVTLPDLRICTT